MNVEKIDEAASKKFLKLVEKNKIKQCQLVKLCEKVGMPMTQPDVCKLYKGKKLSLYQAAAVCKALHISLDMLIWGEEAVQEDFCATHDSETLVSHQNEKEFQGYEGRFNAYFLSTSENEDKLIRGVLNIHRRAEYYDLTMTIYTGVADAYGNEAKKEYKGRLLIAIALQAAYVMLKNESAGELCFISLRHRRFNVKQVECRMGLCLTVCSGDIKIPTMHRILLTRQQIQKKDMDMISPWLKLYGDTLYISKAKMEAFIEKCLDTMPEFQKDFKNLINSGPIYEYYKTSPEILRKQLSLNRQDFIRFISYIYSISECDRNLKIDSSEDSRIFDLIQAISNPGEALSLDEDNGHPLGTFSMERFKKEKEEET